jgi:carboxyl-terminal processing protease
VQTIVPLSGHGAMRLTTARYFTPSGRSIQAKGIDPDILVEQARIETLDSPKRRSESDLRNALDNGNDTEKNKTKKDKSEVAKIGAKEKGRENEPPQDYQLARSLDLLRGIAMFSNKAEKIN